MKKFVLSVLAAAVWRPLLLPIFLALCVAGSFAQARAAVEIVYEGPEGDDAWIRPRLEAAFAACAEAGEPWRVHLRVDPALPSEGYAVRRNRLDGVITIRGGDRRGLIYGGQDVIEQLRHGRTPGTLENRSGRPAVRFRALKFNLPWDSYRRGEPLQQHLEVCRDPAFWERLLDMLSENRFNALTLWNLHPFDFMVQAEGFPEAHTFKGEEMERWRRLFRAIFAMAKERGIETYIVTWNIFVPEGFARAHGVAEDYADHHFIGKGADAPIIRAYTRQVVRQVIEEYPDLTGIGFSLGERMGGLTVEEREAWVLDTYVAAIREASRPVKLIHRAPFSANTASEGSMDHATEVFTRRAIESIEGVAEPIWVEVKFNWSHAHSTPRLIKTHGGPINDVYWNPLPKNYRIAWMMRNEDFFCLRWGNADFIRQHIALNNHDYSGGYFVGSECYIPALDYFSIQAHPEWNYAFERQWLFYMLWGRLLYDPGTPDAVFAREFEARYGPRARPLYTALSRVSTVPLRLISAFDVSWDYTMHAETFSAFTGRDNPHPFITIDELIRQPTLDPDFVSVTEFVEAALTGRRLARHRVTPLRQADEVERACRMALAEIEGIDPGVSEALRQELADVRAWASLGMYYAEKLRAAVDLERCRRTGDERAWARAKEAIERAIGHWDELIAVTDPVYRPFATMLYLGTETPRFHWKLIRDQVVGDLAIVEAARPKERASQ